MAGFDTEEGRNRAFLCGFSKETGIVRKERDDGQRAEEERKSRGYRSPGADVYPGP